jgi:hypothetical protein
MAQVPVYPRIQDSIYNEHAAFGFVWDINTLTWVKGTTATGALGDATAANQVIGNASLASIDSKISIQQLALQFDGSASPLLYLGEATPGSATASAVWRIMRFDTTSGVKGLWANGAATFSNVWDNRAALSYS